MRADGDGRPVKYFKIQLENVLICGVAPSLVARAILSEHVSLKYSKIKWSYTQQGIGGGLGVIRSVAGTWQQTRSQHIADMSTMMWPH